MTLSELLTVSFVQQGSGLGQLEEHQHQTVQTAMQVFTMRTRVLAVLTSACLALLVNLWQPLAHLLDTTVPHALWVTTRTVPAQLIVISADLVITQVVAEQLTALSVLQGRQLISLVSLLAQIVLLGRQFLPLEPSLALTASQALRQTPSALLSASVALAEKRRTACAPGVLIVRRVR